MGIIYFIDGEKGGVGKSLFAVCLIHFLEVKAIPYQLVDADPNNADVAEIYDGIKNIHFTAVDAATALYSKQAGRVDRIFEIAMKKDVIVNLPANVHEQVKYWIEQNNLLDRDFLKQTGVSFCKFFLSNGSFKSIELLKKSLEEYQGKIPHIIVRNQGLNLDWKTVIESESYQKLKSKYNLREIDFPGLRCIERDYLEEKKQPFSEVIPNLSGISQQRFKTFLKSTMTAIEATQEFARYKEVKVTASGNTKESKS